MIDVDKQLERLKTDCESCRKCKIGGVLVEGRFLSNVLSNMNYSVPVMVAGQNPGREEIERREPFVGEAGRRFGQALWEIAKMTRTDLYITNTVKCFTPDNRKPFCGEIDACREFMDREIEIIKPKVIVALGAIALKQLTGVSGVMKHHGEVIMSLRYRIPVMPVLHPSPLNTNNPVRKAMFLQDIGKLKEFLHTT